MAGSHFASGDQTSQSQNTKAFPSVGSVLVWHNGRTLLRKGVVAPAAASATGGQVEVLAIAQKALTLTPDPDGLSQPTYIPDLQVRFRMCGELFAQSQFISF